MNKRLTTAVKHQKQKVLQKIGRSEKTTDQDFEQQRQNWQKMVNHASNIDRDLKKQKKLEGFNVPLLAIAESLNKFFEDSETDSHHGEQFLKASEEINFAVGRYQEQQNKLRLLVQDFLKRLLAVKPRIHERDNLQLDYDKWRSTVKKYVEQPPKDESKAVEAEKKFQSYKELFEKANETLTTEISEMWEERYTDFEDAYRLMVESQYHLFSAISDAYKSIGASALSNTTNLPEPVSSVKSPESSTSAFTSSAPAAPTPSSQPEPTPTPTSTPNTAKIQFKANYDFPGTDEDELPFNEGDIITVVESYDDTEWWKGELNGKTGLFPTNYCERL